VMLMLLNALLFVMMLAVTSHLLTHDLI